jgi:hypothetical protein
MVNRNLHFGAAMIYEQIVADTMDKSLLWRQCELNDRWLGSHRYYKVVVREHFLSVTLHVVTRNNLCFDINIKRRKWMRFFDRIWSQGYLDEYSVLQEMTDYADSKPATPADMETYARRAAQAAGIPGSEESGTSCPDRTVRP